MPELIFPPGDFAAYIFDCDGTLVDSMPLHLKAWRVALEQHGFPPEKFTLQMHHDFAGMPGTAIVEKLNAEFGCQLPPAQVEADKVEWYLAHHGDVGGIEPVIAIARAAQGRIPMAVASGSDAHIVHDSLKAVGIHDLFLIVVTPADVARGKPAPDMFLLCAERMGVAPEKCLVFEDGQLGIQAAEAAGMGTVFVSTEFSSGG
jgi:beta-phosphoglucomutase-like phosphatase (HAD superfamily)